MAVLRVNGEPAYDEDIGLGYNYSTVSFAPVRLKIGSTYVPFSNNPPSGWKYSNIQRIKLTKDKVEYKPIKKEQYIKFNIVLAPGPYNTAASADEKVYAANNDGAFAYPLVTDSYIISDPGYHIILLGYASARNSNAMQVLFRALSSARVATGSVKYQYCNAIVDSIESSCGPWGWWWSPCGSFLTGNAKIWWRLVTCSSNTTETFSAYSGKQHNSTGGQDGWAKGSSTNDALGSYYSYKDDKWGWVMNSYGGGVSWFSYDSANNILDPNHYHTEGRNREKDYQFNVTRSVAATTIIKQGCESFTGIARQYLDSFEVDIGPATTPTYVTRYSCRGSSTVRMIREVTIWLD